MKELNDNLVREELQRAGEPPVITDEMVELDRDRITSETDVPEEEFLFRLHGTPCFPRGDLTTVTGPAKSGKTCFVTMLMACGTRRQVLELERISEDPLKVLWYDTEQSRMTTKRILTDRVARMVDTTPLPDEHYYVFNVRQQPPKERVDRLLLAIKTYRPDICIIDGIADLLNDINSGEDSTTLMQQLLTAASDYKCNVTALIHLNRSGEKLNLRGWIGTTMLQKSYEVINCDRVPKTGTFTVSMTFSRRYSLDWTFYYAIDDTGIPQTTERPAMQDRDGQGHFMAAGEVNKTGFNSRYTDEQAANPQLPWDFRRLFGDAMGSAAMVGYDDLESRVKQLANIRQKQYYYRVFAEAERLNIVRKVFTKGGRVAVIMVPTP